MITVYYEDERNNVHTFKKDDQEQAYSMVRQMLSDGTYMKNIEYIYESQKCRVCGCDDLHACKGGCYWVEKDLCSQCFDKMTSHQIKIRTLELVGIEELEEISDVKIIAEEIENQDIAYGFIHGYVEGKGNLKDSEIIFDDEDCIGGIFIGISIWQNDEPIEELFFDEV